MFNAHTFLVIYYPAEHPDRVVFEEARAFWRKWFGNTRDVATPTGGWEPGHPKGFVEMALGDANQAPPIGS